MNEIRTIDIQHLYDNMANAGYARGTILKIRNILRPCFESAVEDHLIDRNPFDSVKLKINTDKEKHHKAIPSEKMKVIRDDITNIEDDDLRRMTALLCYSGMRIGEILGLKWEDIDVDAKTIHVVRNITHPQRNAPIIGEPKTKAGKRDIPLMAALYNGLKPIKDIGFILGGDKPFSYVQYTRRWDKIKKRYELNGFSLHDMRDTCITEWYENGIKIGTISKIAGHANTSTTEKFYIKVRGKSIDDACMIMNEMYDGTPQKE